THETKERNSGFSIFDLPTGFQVPAR
ncbi:hypothetical protein E3A20_23680, partial [Planctomyces bekefii]